MTYQPDPIAYAEADDSLGEPLDNADAANDATPLGEIFADEGSS